MLNTFVSIAGIVFTICFVVGTHEFGHFITARLVGVKVLKFSIGFGKTLLKWRGKSGTEYVFALIPLGGFVQMLDENEVNVPEDQKHRAYNQQPYYKKFLIALAGPAVNILCAIILYIGIFMLGFTTFKPIVGKVTPNSIAARAGLQTQQEVISIDGHETKGWMSIVFRLLTHAGENNTLTMQTSSIDGKNIKNLTFNLSDWRMDKLTPDPLSSLGIKPFEPEIPLIIKRIQPDSPASRSGLKADDEMIAIEQMKIKNWSDLMETVSDNPGKTLSFLVKRKNNYLTIPVKVGEKRSYILWEKGFLGISPEIIIPDDYLKDVQYGFFGSIQEAFKQVTTFCYFNFMVLGKLITGKLSVQSLGGPITIFSAAGSSIQNGIVPFLSFLAFLSIAIGIINILPIPGLDGGHLLLETIQVIIGRPIPETILLLLYRMGVFIIIFVLIQAVVNDILRMY